ncbi:MAG: Uma2 family endonuclease, partial [Planctomycetia bacterium]|nr:Uma2 family endonuclease [Planctomycetia bacterium]
MTQRVGGPTGTDRRRRPAVISLAVPTDARLRVSPTGFWRLCRENRDLRLERTAEGVLIVMPPAGPDSSRRNMSLGAQLWNWNERSGLGVAFDSSAGFTLPNTAVRGPDATWMSRERWDTLPQEERDRFSRICPDFVVELRSKTDPKKRVRLKMQEYLAQGVRLGWLIDPRTRTVEIYRPGQPVEILKQPKT